MRMARKKADSWFELKSNGTWTDGEYSGTYNVKNGEITILLDGEEFMTGTIKDGVMEFDLLGIKITYKKDSASSSTGSTNQGGNNNQCGNQGSNNKPRFKHC